MHHTVAHRVRGLCATCGFILGCVWCCSPPPSLYHLHTPPACGPELSLEQKVWDSQLIIEGMYPGGNCTLYCQGWVRSFTVLWTDVDAVRSMEAIRVHYLSTSMPVDIDTIEPRKRYETLKYIMFLSVPGTERLERVPPDSVAFYPVGNGRHRCAYNGFEIATPQLRAQVDSLIVALKEKRMHESQHTPAPGPPHSIGQESRPAPADEGRSAAERSTFLCWH
jgi:hypothetical protein